MDLRAMARGYSGPTCLIHGEMDELVPVDCAYEYGDIYKDAMELCIVPGANHQFRSLKWKQKVYDTSIEFLNRQLV